MLSSSLKIRFLLLMCTLILLQDCRVQASRMSRWVKMNNHIVCFGTRDNKYGSFHNYAKQGLVAVVKLVYLSGYVRCANGARYNSRWGCANHGGLKQFPLNVVGTDQNNRILFPRQELIEHKGGNWYWLPFTNTVSSSELVFADPAHPFYFPLNKQMRIWYGEDLAGSTESDNSGRVCVNVHAKFLR